MSVAACEIIGTGDGELKNSNKIEGTASTTIANDLVLEIIDNALEIVDETSEVTTKKIVDQILMEECKGKHLLQMSAPKEKSAAPLTGEL